MKKTITSIVLVTLVLLGACKKDNAPSDTEKKYTIKVLKNNTLQKEFIYTSSKFQAFNRYDGNEELSDYAEFQYNNGKLVLMAKVSTKDNSRLNFHYVYNSNGMLTNIEEGKGTTHEKIYNITYDNKDRMRKIDWSIKDQPFDGEFLINAYGNVDKYRYDYVSSNMNKNESRTYSFEQFKNPLQRFWMISLDEISISVNNPVEQIINTQTSPIGGGQIQYVTELESYQYTYNSDGYILTKTVLDTNNQIIDFYEYQYIEN